MIIMTLDQRIKEIKERMEKSTPGPWFKTKDCYVVQTNHITRDVWTIADCLHDPENDGHFIAHSRSDIEFLVKALDIAVNNLTRMHIEDAYPNLATEALDKIEELAK